MTFDLSIPEGHNKVLTFSISPGQSAFVLGPNGAGKSTLMHRFFVANHGARRISAHRQTWFNTGASTLSANDKRQTETNIGNSDRQTTARWKDDYSAQRASVSIYDLVDAENIRARAITKAVDDQDVGLAQVLARKDAPIKQINALLRLSNVAVEISFAHGEQIMASRSGGVPYSIAELSDGERNALLIAADVLTVQQGTLVLIDEPERHLHRSIISPLLTLLFRARSDCAFVISTHEILLSLDSPTSQTLLVRDCTYVSGSVYWRADLVSSASAIDESLKREIFGARQKMLFVEGNENSLDSPLYSLVFPQITVRAKESCRDVEHAVSGIRDAAELHWVHAWGIVDNDRRAAADIERLKAKGISALPVYSVESIYYHPVLQRRVAERHAQVVGGDPALRFESATTSALLAIGPHGDRLAQRAVEKALREDVMRMLPGRKEIAAGAAIQFSFDIADLVAVEKAAFDQALSESNLALLVSRYPVRETPALDRIAENLGFQGRAQYEGAVLQLLADDGPSLHFVRELFGDLPAELGILPIALTGGRLGSIA